MTGVIVRSQRLIVWNVSRSATDVISRLLQMLKDQDVDAMR